MKTIAELFIKNGLIKTDPKQPLIMTGTKSLYPILIERPEMLTDPQLREALVNSFVDEIKRKKYKPKYIISSKKTSTPLGVLVANKLGIPFLLPHRDEVFEIKKLLVRNLDDVEETYMKNQNIQAIASTTPGGLPWASIIADKYKLPLLIIRQKLNRLEIGECIEGLSHLKDKPTKILVLDMNSKKDSYEFKGMLDELKIDFDVWVGMSRLDDYSTVEQRFASLAYTDIVQIEDIIRRGGTSLRVANTVSALSAKTQIICAFNYELIDRRSTDWRNITIDSLATFSEVMNELEPIISKEEISEIHSWHANPVEWEEKFLQRNGSIA